MVVALRAMEDDGLEAILDPERTSRTATDLWNGLNAHQFIGQVNKNIFWSWPCRHLDCRALAPGDLWLQTKENPEDHGHFGCHKCVRAYAPFRTSVALAPAQRVMMVKMKPDSQDMAAMDCASFVRECESGTQFRHYLTEWPSDSVELAQSRLSLAFLNIKDECATWPAKDMFNLIAEHAVRFHHEACWDKVRLGPAKIAEFEQMNINRAKKWKWDHFPVDQHGPHTFTSTYEYTDKTYVMTSTDTMRLYGCMLTTAAMFTAVKSTSEPGRSSM
ncbi:unnamed protein product [Polarella glacialis]|uniref:Uncharacterized protein n=1 Tax=Polarella glacialis TaxID=89957 RepID=A0A813HFW1_POLGL|nr:unnamed protein product [Polarella glacialis]